MQTSQATRFAEESFVLGGQILDALEIGPQWPSTLSFRLRIPESSLREYLLTLLINGWIEIVPPDSTPRGAMPAPQAPEGAPAGSAASKCRRLSALGEPNRRESAAELWRAFFDPADPAPACSLAVTSSGREALRRCRPMYRRVK